MKRLRCRERMIEDIKSGKIRRAEPCGRFEITGDDFKYIWIINCVGATSFSIFNIV